MVRFANLHPAAWLRRLASRPFLLPVSSLVCRFALLLSLLLSGLIFADASAVNGPSANPRQTWQLLDYVAVDYAGAVKDGRVVATADYAEMRPSLDPRD